MILYEACTAFLDPYAALATMEAATVLVTCLYICSLKLGTAPGHLKSEFRGEIIIRKPKNVLQLFNI